MKELNEYEKQANDFLEATGTTFKAVLLGHMPYFNNDKEKRDVYEITLERKGKSYTFRFGQSLINTGTKPTAYDVLACLQKYDPETFEDFCIDFGYNTDSRKALEIYLAVQDEYNNVIRLFGDVMEDLEEIC